MKLKIKCSKCSTILAIDSAKLPKNKNKATVKCPKCKHSVVFTVPDSKQEEEDKTEVGNMEDSYVRGMLIEKGSNKEHPLKRGNNIIGRRGDISVANDRYMSKLHCLIEMNVETWGVEFVLSDDGTATGKPSTNGTFINDKKISEYDKIVLKNNDTIKVGHTYFTVKLS